MINDTRQNLPSREMNWLMCGKNPETVRFPITEKLNKHRNFNL